MKEVGERYVYALDILDIVNFLGKDNLNDINSKMDFLTKNALNTGYSLRTSDICYDLEQKSEQPRLLSLYKSGSYYKYDFFQDLVGPLTGYDLETFPAFVIDLSSEGLTFIIE